MANNYDINSKRLIEDFNQRNNHAFEFIFVNLYNALYRFCSKLYVNTTVSPDDVIQDIFLRLLKSNTTFESIEHLKSYIYLSLKNSYKRYSSHQHHIEAYTKHVKQLSEEEISSEVVNSEVIAHLSQSIEILPQEYSTILKMYIEGYSSTEISEKLNIALSTVYKRKDQALEHLKKQISSDMLNLFLLFL
ncbi:MULTISPECIES: RNA polymerase sigma factor [Butyricimonas]|uniref:RNA polymerase sigma factor n=1 Tax=Butyricimonas TaxID=574697 RepID=UPI0007FB4FE1|nr:MULTISPECIES: RNA polymerase sigma factor [Butyricimonas]